MEISVKAAQRSYNITLERGALSRADKYLALDRRVLIVTDDGVPAEYAGLVAEKCKTTYTVTLPQGESSKNIKNLELLLSRLVEYGFTRSDCVVAVGGGVVGDIAGFAASVYMRGIDFYNIPTTLLSQVDSSIGGKTAINLDGVKNAVGTIITVDTLIDTRFLQTLSDEQLDDGFGEIEKYRLLDEQISKYKGDTDGLIALCANYKQMVVQSDLHDCGARKRLNLGHTVAHGLELTYGITHGQAVKYGLYYEMALAVNLGVVEKAFFDQWTSGIALDLARYPLTQQVLLAMTKDKKNYGGRIVFVLPTQNFDVKEVALTMEQVTSYVAL